MRVRVTAYGEGGKGTWGNKTTSELKAVLISQKGSGKWKGGGGKKILDGPAAE